MGSLKLRLLGIAIAALVGAHVVVGCSADGTGDGGPILNDDPTDPGSPIPNTPASTVEGSASGEAGVKTDAGKSEGGTKEAGPPGLPPPPPPAEGETCATPNQVFKRSCGLC